MKKISVITINKNNAQGLQKTIESVIGQTFKNYEFIIIDGASNDDSIDIIKKYTRYITYWVSEPDNGIFHAMNKGITEATGEYTVFLNSGDCFIADETLFNVFSEERNKDILAGIGVTEKVLGDVRMYPPAKITLYELATYPMCHQALFIKKELFEEIGGYDENLQIVSDWKFYLLAVIVYKKELEVINIDIALIEPYGLSTQAKSDAIISKEKKDILIEYFPYFYDDYILLRKVRRFTWRNIKTGILVRLNRFLQK